jgi:hypothetical protein
MHAHIKPITETIPARLTHEHFQRWQEEYHRINPRVHRGTKYKLHMWFSRLRMCTDLRNVDLTIQELMAFKTANIYSFYMDALTYYARIMRYFTSSITDETLAKVKERALVARIAHREAKTRPAEHVERAREHVRMTCA